MRRNHEVTGNAFVFTINGQLSGDIRVARPVAAHTAREAGQRRPSRWLRLGSRRCFDELLQYLDCDPPVEIEVTKD